MSEHPGGLRRSDEHGTTPQLKDNPHTIPGKDTSSVHTGIGVSGALRGTAQLHQLVAQAADFGARAHVLIDK